MSTAKKVGSINEYEINSISAGNIERYILQILNCCKMDLKMIYLEIILIYVICRQYPFLLLMCFKSYSHVLSQG